MKECSRKQEKKEEIRRNPLGNNEILQIGENQ